MIPGKDAHIEKVQSLGGRKLRTLRVEASVEAFESVWIFFINVMSEITR